jgi:hypothetical protein
MSLLPSDCARARESVSAQLDGELPELDLDRLETHLRICPECSSWAGEVRDVTHQLREATPEVPAARFVLPRHGRRLRVSSAVALASAAAVVATMFVAPREHALRAGSSSSRLPDLTAGAIFSRPPVLDSLTPGSPIPAGWPVHPL